MQWAIKTPSRSSCKPASKRSELSKTEDRLQPAYPRSRPTQTIRLSFPLQLRHSLFVLPRLRVLPLPRLRPLDHPPHERLHLLPRVARMQAHPHALPTLRHSRPCDRTCVQTSRTQVGGERARVRREDGDDRRGQRAVHGRGRAGRVREVRGEREEGQGDA